MRDPNRVRDGATWEMLDDLLRPVTYECFKCKHVWVDRPSDSLHCPECDAENFNIGITNKPPKGCMGIQNERLEK